MILKLACCLFVFLIIAQAMKAAEPTGRTIIYEGKVTVVGATQVESPDLWVPLRDLTQSTGFVVKPEGICRDELCFPIPKNRRAQFVTMRGRVTWFNLSEFARLVKQPVAHDAKNAVWFFGPRPDVQNGFLATLEAPDF